MSTNRAFICNKISSKYLCHYVDSDELRCLRIGTNVVWIRRHRRIGLSTNRDKCGADSSTSTNRDVYQIGYLRIDLLPHEHLVLTLCLWCLASQTSCLICRCAMRSAWQCVNTHVSTCEPAGLPPRPRCESVLTCRAVFWRHAVPKKLAFFNAPVYVTLFRRLFITLILNWWERGGGTGAGKIRQLNLGFVSAFSISYLLLASHYQK